MKQPAQIVKAQLGNLYVKNIMARKGWSKDHTIMLIVDYVTSGLNISLGDFLEASE